MKLKIPSINNSSTFNLYLTIFTIIFVIIAITNLIHGIALIASTLLLLIIFLFIVLSWQVNGRELIDSELFIR